MELVIDRGVKSYDVKDADGTLLGVIKINPADIGISGRFVSARNAIAELAEQAKQDAGQQVEQAQANLEHVKANLPNAAELKAAEAALAQAKTVQQQAQVKLAAAKAALDKANRQVEQAKAKLTETSTNLVNALKALEDARNAGNATKPGKDMDIDPGYTIPGSEEFGGNTNDGKNDSGDDTITTVISDKTGAHHGKHAAKADAQTTQATRSPRPARTSKRLQPLAS